MHDDDDGEPECAGRSDTEASADRNDDGDDDDEEEYDDRKTGDGDVYLDSPSCLLILSPLSFLFRYQQHQ